VIAAERTKRVFNTREERDSVFGSLIGATVIAIIATSAFHLIPAEPISYERILIGGIGGGIGGIIGLFIISEIVGRRWFRAILLSVAIGVLDGLLVGAAIALFPSIL
jgi:hypothetical protein